MIIRRFVLAASLFFVNITAVYASTTAFFYTSSPLSWTGHGQTVLVTPADGFVFAIQSIDLNHYVQFTINETNNDRTWFFDITAPTGSTLTVGEYANTQRFAFATDGHPGLDFYGNGRGNSTATGSFKVLELTYKPDGSLLNFAADFTQYDEGNTEWWNKGGIRINSDVPITTASTPVPEPQTYAMWFAGLGLLGIFARRRKSN